MDTEKTQMLLDSSSADLANVLSSAVVLEQAAQPFILTDTSGIIQYSNPRFSQLCGYEREELAGRNCKLLQSGNTPPSTYARLWKDITAGNIWRGTLQNKRKDGSFYWQEQTISPIADSFGKITCFMAWQRDITKRVFASGMLRRKKRIRAQRSEFTALGKFSSIAAHRANNILAALEGNLELLRRYSRTESEGCERLNSAMDCSRALARLFDDLLVIGGKGCFLQNSVHLSQCCSEVIREQKQEFERLCNIRSELDFSLPTIGTDLSRLRQLIRNLIQQRVLAASATSICVRTGMNAFSTYDSLHCAFPGTLEPGPVVYIEVEDDGASLELHTDGTIYLPEVSECTAGSTALLIPLIQGALYAMHGAMEARKKTSGSSLVRMFLPLQPGGETSLETEWNDDRMRGLGDNNPAVLVIEDDAIVREVVQHVLLAEGFRVYATSNGFEALTLLEQHKNEIGAAVVDLILPNMTGGETIRRLREISPSLRIVLASGYSSGSDIANLLKQPHTHLLKKPYTPNALTELLRNMLVTDS